MHEGAAPPGAPRAKAAFLAALAAVTFLPLITIPVAQLTAASSRLAALPPIVVLVALAGVGHVGATAYYYVDGDFRGLVRESRSRFVVLPLALACGFALGFVSGHALWGWLAAGFFAWQLYHYQRQNYGLLALTALSARVGQPPRAIRLSFNLAAVAGVLGAAGPQGIIGGVLPEVAPRLDRINRLDPRIHALAIVVYALALVGALWAVARHRAFFRAPLVALFALAGLAFYVPALVSRDPFVTFWSYAIAHGAQYLLLMGVLSRGAARPRLNLSALAALTMALTLVFLSMTTTTGFLHGAYYGLVVGHFLIDAKTWRLREPAQRAIIKQRFGFLF
jgi:hypothetical protein